MDPISAAIAQFAGGFGKSLGGSLTAPPAGPSAAEQHTYGTTTLDGSGWSVNLGAGQLYAAPTKTQISPEGIPQSSLLGGAPTTPTLQAGGWTIALIVGGMLAWRLMHRGHA